jgi:hypothetical protein
MEKGGDKASGLQKLRIIMTWFGRGGKEKSPCFCRETVIEESQFTKCNKTYYLEAEWLLHASRAST